MSEEPAAPVLAEVRAAGLCYSSDSRPGLLRRRRGSGFDYFHPAGARVRDLETLRRIRSLAIPPAWSAVWICPREDGHLQAVGRDARGRKQYRYHPRWRELRDAAKYERLLAFGKALPRIRRQVAADLRRPGLSREKVLALVVRLLETTLIRVGNDEYVEQNDSFGLTTLRNRHAKVRGGQTTFEFRGKSGRSHRIDVHDPRLAKLVRRCQELPGQELFGYVDDSGAVRDVGSADVNAYLRELAGEEFSAKDFRTWAGTVLAAIALRESGGFSSEKQAKRNVVRAVEAVADMLGNTPAVCRRCYIHPAVVESYLNGRTIPKARPATTSHRRGQLEPDEIAVMRLLGEKRARNQVSRTTSRAGLSSRRPRNAG